MESSHLNKPAYRSKHEDVKKKKKQKKTSKSYNMGKGSKKKKKDSFFILIMCLSLYDYQAKVSRYRKGLTYLKNRATTNQNQTLHSQKNEKYSSMK